jgi:hypothetical protein
MRKILLFILLLIGFVSYGQVYQKYNQYGMEINRVLPDSLQGLPKDTFYVPQIVRKIPHIAAKGTSIYLWDTTLLKWGLYASGSGSGTYDSTYTRNDSLFGKSYGTEFWAGLRINQKLNITDTASMMANTIVDGYNSITKVGRNLKLGGASTENTIVSGQHSFTVNKQLSSSLGQIYADTAQLSFYYSQGHSLFNRHNIKVGFDGVNPNSLSLYSYTASKAALMYRSTADSLLIGQSRTVSDFASFNYGKVLIKYTPDSLMIKNLPSITDTSANKPAVMDATGKMSKSSYWYGGGSGSGSSKYDSTYTRNDSLFGKSYGLEFYTGLRINQKLNLSDTSGMLANYLNSVGWGLVRIGQTIRADTNQVETKANGQKGEDSLGVIISTKLPITDTLKPGRDFVYSADSLFLRGAWVNLKDFTGAADDNSTDNSAPLLAAVATGKNVFIPPGGIFRFSASAGITLNPGQVLFGAGPKSQLRYTGTLRAILPKDSSIIANFKLTGNGKNSGNTFETGIMCYLYKNWVIKDMIIEDFGGTAVANGGGGIFITGIATNNSEGASVINCRVMNCNAGINAVSRSEYVNVIGGTVSKNNTGISLGSGNFMISTVTMEENGTGFKIYSGANNGHGTIQGCMINHSSLYAIEIQDVAHELGFVISNCHFYYGALYFKNANNIKFSNCHFGSLDSVHIENSRYLQRVGCQWGKNLTLNPIPVSKYGTSDDFATIGEIGYDTNPVAWIYQVNTSDTSKFSGLVYIGSSSQFRVNNSGNLVRINNIPYSFPSAQAVSPDMFMKNDGSGNLSWDKVNINFIGAATGTNTIDNVNYKQEWKWDALAGTDGIKLSSVSTQAASDAQVLLQTNLSGANVNSNQTTYTFRATNTHTGTGSSNIAAYLLAGNGSNNYALITDGGNSGFATLTPNSIVQVSGSLSLKYVAKTANYTADITDYLIDCTSNTFTITLPTAVGIEGRTYIVKNSGAGTITIATTSSQTIDGATTKTLNTQYSGLTLVSDNVNWKVISIF